MIDFYITEQSIRFSSPVIAANSLNFLEAKFHFNGSTWDGCSKWAHFRQGENVYDINLEDNMIKPDMGLNLSLGEWEVYITGNSENKRLTTVPIILTVMESGLVDEPLHAIPQSVAEQVDSKAELALQKVMKLESDAESGKFDGSSFVILGYYASLNELKRSVSEPKIGDTYCVGTEAPYDMYVYDGVNGCWMNNGPVIGVKGDKGEQGVTFIPNVSENGNLSWRNNGGLQNPAAVNIMGPKGDRGDRGEDGKTPYEIAVEQGFQGTQETFNWSLKNIASHAAGHGENGADPITVTTGSIADRAVTGAKIAAGAVSAVFAATIGTAWTGEAGPYTQTVNVNGMTAEDRPTIGVVYSEDFETAKEQKEAWNNIYRIKTGTDSISVYAEDKTETEIPVQIICVRK